VVFTTDFEDAPMSNPNDPYVERTVVEQPATVRTEYSAAPAARGSGAAGWWIAALVAVVAIVGLVFMFNNNSTSTDLQAATDAGRSQAMMETATAQAQSAAQAASEASANAASSMAASTQAAADSARNAADRTAEAAQDTAAAASDAAQEATDAPQ
jgi:hypothetical protein